MWGVGVMKDNEDGVSLIELIVYVSLMFVVSFVVFGSFSSITKSSSAVEDRFTTASSGQLVSNSLSYGILSSAEFNIDTFENGDQLLSAVVAKGANDWVCEAWSFTGDKLYHKVSSTMISPPENGDYSEWTMIGENLSPGYLRNDKNLFLDPEPIDNRLEYGFYILGEENKISFSNTVIARAVGDRDIVCF